MRIMILGGDGMLGHQLLRYFSHKYEARATLHRSLADYAEAKLFNSTNTLDRIDARDFEVVQRVVNEFQPDVIINAIGIVKQRTEARDAIPSIEINALFPHRMAALCRDVGARFIHMSTDCVFSGNRGNYRETDAPDAEDIYGRSKLLGEVSAAPAITLRTSIIGRELYRKSGLFEWFLAQRGRTIRGFRRAIFSGFTTIEMARIIERVLTARDPVNGLYHVSSAAISKFELLCAMRDRMKLDITIEPDDNFVCDRSLDSSCFRAAFDYEPPSWNTMIDELAHPVI